MRKNKIEVYVHFVWPTWDRLPLIHPTIERRLHRFIAAVAVEMGCKVLAINGTEDHVHVLLSLRTTVTIADLAKRMKGASSLFANTELFSESQFKWSGSYGAFSVSRWDVPKIMEYIKRQKEHHATGELLSEYEVSDMFQQSAD